MLTFFCFQFESDGGHAAVYSDGDDGEDDDTLFPLGAKKCVWACVCFGCCILATPDCVCFCSVAKGVR